MANITLYSLSDYNNGCLVPFTIELEGLSYEGYLQAIADELAAIDEKMGNDIYTPVREEWIVADYEDVPSCFVSEWSIDEKFFTYQEALESSCLDEEVFKAGVSLGVPLDKIEEAYAGSFDSDTDLAYDYIESTGMLADVPESVTYYFDYSSYGRDLAINYSEMDHHYFSSCY